MPGKIKVKVLAGRNLPVMDRASETTDAFVEIKFGSVTHKTDVCRKSLNPHWNSTEWYRFEVDESELQDEPLQLRLMDHDTYSANDAIGKVVISLAPLLAREANNVKNTAAPHGGAVMSGWIPVFDTMHGIRGELNVIVKVELFSDFNKYKTSSCGVQFFHCPIIPPGYRATAIHGFVEELVVNDDPEYQWIDKIRTPRASNEARQVAFIKLSNQVQRLVGLKAAELGANAVVGYQQDFDLEGEAGVVARAIGTAVSIAPLPTPSQPINIPPCTQQQLKKYLDILTNDNENITDLSQYYQTHQEELQKMINILNPNASSLLDESDILDDDEKSMDMTRQSSITSSYIGGISLYQDDYVSQKSLRHLSEDQTDLNKLLNREADDSDSSGTLQKIKKIKNNFFSKKFTKTKKTPQSQEDQISIKSTSSDNSRISIYDIKNEIKKLKIKKPKFRKLFVNKEDEGEGMASILARSVIHARTSLACIAEKDSEQSPTSTMRRTSESEPTINISDDDKSKLDVATKSTSSKIPEIRFTSLSNINADIDEAPKRKISESCPASPVALRPDNQLKLPGEEGYFDSVSSALSGESSDIYSSSEEDDESSDLKTDTEKSIETTTSVVQTVLSHEINPVLIAQMDEKLGIVESIISDDSDINQDRTKKNDDNKHHLNIQKENKSDTDLNELQITTENKLPIEKCKSLSCVPRIIEGDKDIKEKMVKSCEVSTTSVKEDASVSKSNSHHIKFHNPFAHKKVSKSISAPSSPVEKSSFVYRSSKRIKRQLSKLSKNNMIKSFSHYSLRPKKETKTTLSHPGSSTDIHSKAPGDTVLGTPFMSYTDLLSLDREANKPFYRTNDAPHGKVSMYIGSEPASRASFSGVSSLNFGREEHHDDHKKHPLKASGLVHTAMETILLDKVQNLLIPTSPDCHSSETKQFFSDVNEKLEKVEKSQNEPHREVYSDSRSNTGSLSPTMSSVSSYNKLAIERETKSKEKSPSLVQTAMETILMDKVQSMMIPTSPDTPHPQPVFSDLKNTKENSDVRKSLSIQTQSSPKTPDTKSPATSEKHFPFFKFDRHAKSQKQEVKPTGLIHTAMETMLMEKVQSVLGPTTPEPVISKVFFEEQTDPSEDPNKEKTDDTSLIQTAIQTILMDKAQVALLGSELPEPVIDNLCTENKVQDTTKHNKDILEKSDDDLKSPGLIQLAVQTMLLEKAQSLVPTESLNTESKQNETTIQESSKTLVPEENVQTNVDLVDVQPNSTGLIESAIQTIVLETVQTLVPNIDQDIISKKPEADVLNSDLVTNDAQNSKSQSKKSLNKLSDDTDSMTKNVELNENSGLVQSAVQTILLDKVQSLMPDTTISIATSEPMETKAIESKSGLISTALETILIDKAASLLPAVETVAEPLEKDNQINQQTEVESKGKNTKKLTRQDSVHSLNEFEMSKSRVIAPCITKTPVLQHFHPILSGAPLETIPSLPESSLDHCESIDSDTNKASVCGNLHAACDADRSDRDRESKSEKDRGSPRHARHESYGGKEPQAAHAQNSSLNASSTPLGIHRRSSDSDLSVTPKGGSLTTSAGNVGSGGGAILRPSMNSNNLDMLEYPFLTMSEYPPGFIVHIGGTVCARSVKLVEGEGGGTTRAAWWAELRTELRAHARALRCNAVIAYCDTAAICEDVCVLSASGTAAVINLDCDFNAEVDINGSKTALEEIEAESCSMSHVPYSPGSGPYRAELASCGGCRRARVPSVMLATCAKPNRLAAHSKAITLTAVAARVRRAPPTSEPGARDISDQLPFLEYELHKLLLAKLRMQGANALFSLQTQIAVGERCVMALASGTAFRLAALPPPTPPRIKASENDKDAVEIQKALWDTFKANTIANGFEMGNQEHQTNGVLQETENDDAPALDLCADKDACVLELDEAEDVETARSLATRQVNMQVFTPSLKPALGAPPLAFAQVWRGRLSLSGQGGAVSTTGEKQVRRALSGAAYKLRRLQPAALVAPTFQLDLPDDEIQLMVSGTAIPLQDPSKTLTNGSSDTHTHANATGDADDDIFALDEEQLVKSQPVENEDKNVLNGHVPTAVSLTSLSCISGARLVRRLCALRLLFVRETTAVRELGGLSGFLHTFTCEVLAIVRAYTAALGGNTLTSFYITQLMLQDNAHKNQGQCLLSVGGDVVHITY